MADANSLLGTCSRDGLLFNRSFLTTGPLYLTDCSKSRLLVTTPEKPDREFIYLYEAAFASELLEMLDNPTLATERATWPTIRLKKIPFEPYADFQPRIIAELLAPIA